MMWPHEDYTQLSTERPSPLTTVSEDQMLQLHKLLSLEKFIHLTTVSNMSLDLHGHGAEEYRVHSVSH